MSWHTAAYTGSIAGTANTDLPADPSDQVLTILNGHFVLREQMSLMGSYAIGALLTRARFDSPSMRFYGSPFIRPVRNGAHPATNDNIDLSWGHPFALPIGEELAVQVSNSGAGPTQTTVFAFLGKQLEPVPAGNVYKVRFTSTTTLVVNTWTTMTYTFDTGLPSGAFAMVGSEVISTNAIAHRWIFYRQFERPGFISLGTEALRGTLPNYDYRWGVMGRFINTAPPILQGWSDTADASHVGYAYLIPISPTSIVTTPQGQPMIPAGSQSPTTF